MVNKTLFYDLLNLVTDLDTLLSGTSKCGLSEKPFVLQDYLGNEFLECQNQNFW